MKTAEATCAEHLVLGQNNVKYHIHCGTWFVYLVRYTNHEVSGYEGSSRGNMCAAARSPTWESLLPTRGKHHWASIAPPEHLPLNNVSTHIILPTHGKKHQVYWPGAPTTVNHCVRPAYFLPTYLRVMFSSVRVDQEHLCKSNTIKNPSLGTMDHVNIFQHDRQCEHPTNIYIPMLVVNIPSSRIYCFSPG